MPKDFHTWLSDLANTIVDKSEFKDGEFVHETAEKKAKESKYDTFTLCSCGNYKPIDGECGYCIY